MFVHSFCDYGCLHVPIYPISHHHVRLCRVLYLCFSLLSKHTYAWLDVLCILLYRYGKYCLGTNSFLPTSTLGYYAYQYSFDESTQFCCLSSRYNPSLLVLCRILSGQRRHYNTHPSFAKIAVFGEPFNLKFLNFSQVLTLSFVLVCAVIGIVHFMNQKRNDNIRTRLFYQIFVTIDLLAIVFFFLQPQHYEALLSVMIVTTAPLIAHFFALTRTRITNWMFIILSYSAIIITLFNLWNLLHNYL